MYQRNLTEMLLCFEKGLNLYILVLCGELRRCGWIMRAQQARAGSGQHYAQIMNTVATAGTLNMFPTNRKENHSFHRTHYVFAHCGCHLSTCKRVELMRHSVC